MAKYHLGCARFTGISAGTVYASICGPGGATGGAGADAAEANRQIRIRFAATLENLFVRMTNDADDASTIRSRVNGANGNLSVSIPALATGDFEDTVNSDSLLTGDLVNTQLVMGGMSTWSAQVLAYTLDNTDDDRGIMVTGIQTDALIAPLPGATTFYFPISGELRAIPRAEAGMDYIFRHGTTFSQLRVFVDTNDPTGASTVRLRVNGADGNLNLSIPGSTTGEFEDTVNSDVIAIGDRVNYRVVTGSGGHGGPEVIITVIQVHHDAPETRVSAAGSSNQSEVGTTSPQFLPIESHGNWTTSLAQIDFGFPARFPFNIRNYYLNMRSNAYDVASVFTVREGVADVDTPITVTIPALTSGRFEDTVNTVTVLVGDRISNEWDAPGWTVGQAFLTNIGMEIYLPPAALENYAPMVVRRVEVLAY